MHPLRNHTPLDRQTALLFCLYLFCLGLFIPALVAGDEPTAERQTQLLHFVRHDCGSCHGLTMAGGLGPPLTPAALSERHPYALTVMILDGVSGTPMPAWRGLLSESEAAWIATQLKEGLGDERQ